MLLSMYQRNAMPRYIHFRNLHMHKEFLKMYFEVNNTLSEILELPPLIYTGLLKVCYL